MSKYSSVSMTQNDAIVFLDECIERLEKALNILEQDLQKEIEEYEKPIKLFGITVFKASWKNRGDFHWSDAEWDICSIKDCLKTAQCLREMAGLGQPIILTTEDYKRVTRY